MNNRSPKEIGIAFYTAFQQLDSDAMTSLYHSDIQFHDPAFGSLHGSRAKAMWQMLCDSQKGKNFTVDYEVVEAIEQKVVINWNARYTFSQTNRKVHNFITATMEIRDGLIINHQDNFNLYAWSKQALGWKGYLLGFTSFFQKSLQQKTNHLLDKYIKRSEN